MKKKKGIELPVATLDLFAVIMFTFILISMTLATEAQQEYQTKVDLLTRQAAIGDGSGTDALTLSITGDGTGYTYTFESKKIRPLAVRDIDQAVKELKRLSPPDILLRIDRKTEFQYPQQLMITAYEQGTRIGFAFLKEE